MPITPYLFYDLAGAMKFLSSAFGLKKYGRAMRGKDGKLNHAAMKFGDASSLWDTRGGNTNARNGSVRPRRVFTSMSLTSTNTLRGRSKQEPKFYRSPKTRSTRIGDMERRTPKEPAFS
jgi:hypothetical protein